MIIRTIVGRGDIMAWKLKVQSVQGVTALFLCWHGFHISIARVFGVIGDCWCVECRRLCCCLLGGYHARCG